MNLKTISAAKAVSGNKLTKLDNVGAKILLAADETLENLETEAVVALTGVAANMLVELIPAEFIGAHAVADKLDVTDFIEAADVGADVAIAGAVGSVAMKFKKSYESLSKIDDMTPEEFEAYLVSRKKGNKAVIEAEIVSDAEALI